MDFQAGRMTTRSQLQGLALILMALIAALSMALASPAQATPNTAKTWGNGTSGQLGNGAMTSSSLPVAVSNLSGVKALAGGNEHAFALLENGTVMAWGSGGQGRLGDGTETGSDVPVGVCEVGYTGPGPCPPEHYLKGVTAIAATGGPGGGVALLQDGTVVDWGELSFSKLGDGATTRSDVPVHVCEVGYSGPTPCPATNYLKEVKAVAGGERFALALFGASSEVAAWGESPLNSGSVFGAGTTKQSYEVPVAVCAVNEKAPCAADLSGVTAIAISEDTGLALSGGKVLAWGDDADGALGDGTTKGADAPVEVQGLSKEVTAIAGGSRFSLALLKGGTVAAWGDNELGQLGDGMMIPPGPEQCGEFKTPCSTKATAAASGLVEVKAIAAGSAHGLALLRSGEVMAWGENSSGQLGNGEENGPEHCLPFATACSKTPVAVSRMAGAKGVAGGERFSLAFGPPPVVTAVKPKQGPVNGGTTVTVTGSDLTGATAVKFGSTSAASFKVNSATSITAVSPAELAGRVDVTVTTTWGTSPISLADRFKFAPTVTGLSPTTGSSAGGTSVTVSGTGFVVGTTATKLRFGTALATSVNCGSTTSCKVLSPAHAVGRVDVRATVNKVTSSRNRPADQFTYN
jgi:alpha-tubulin suppressor-like RCC1 family protein